MSNEAYILVHRKRSRAEGLRFSFSWVGDLRGRVHISRCLINEAGGTGLDWPDCFPWPLVRVSEFDCQTDGAWYARADQTLGLPYLHRLRYGWRRSKELLLCRFIFTLHIWGLANVPEGEIPSWRHVGTR